MHLLSINELFLGRVMTALCWTLFHSLWQGLIAAVFGAFVLIRTKRSSPAVRYNVLSALFLLLTVLFAATFLYELQHSVAAADGGSVSGGKVAMLIQKPDHPAGVRPSVELSLTRTISGFLSRNSSFIVIAWLIILSVKMARMFFVLGYTRHIIRYRSQEPSLYWKQRITLLCQQLRITKSVILLESKIAKLPIVFGQLKPVILVPVGLLTQLAPEQVEAILLHELAHIRRNDYLVNFLQNIIETLFFFNPAVVWLSSLIRDERENCCDDVAISQLQNKKQYVESLISFRERSLYSSSLSAVGFAGRKNSFLNRIRRIVENKNYTLSPFEKGSLACSSIVAASLALAVAIPNGTCLIKPSLQATKSETISRRSMVILRKYTDTLTSAERLTNTVRGKTGTGAGQGIILSRMHQVIGDLVREKVVPDSAAVESFALDKNVFVVNDRLESAVLHEKFKQKYNIGEMGLYYGPEKVPGHGYFFSEKLAPPSGFRDPRVERRMQPVRFINLDQIFADIIDELVAEGIVKDKTDPVSFLLTNRKLVVNGQLQPESIHERLKEKFISPGQYTLNSPEMAEDPDFGLHYNSKSGSSGLGIHHLAEKALP
jgi:beta-lactamase regulating signal transducer with metallopeptidase domain